MNQFKLTTTLANISQMTLVKDIEDTIRSLRRGVYGISYSNRPKNETPYVEVLNPFIAYTACLQKFEEKSNRKLPDFIYTTRKEGATYILEYLMDKGIDITYEEYLGIFKYLNIDLTLPYKYNDGSLYMHSLVYLTDIVKDKPNPYKLNYNNLRPTYYHQHLADNQKLGKLLTATMIRQTKYNNLNYTIIDNYIAHLYSSTFTNALDSLPEILTTAVNTVSAINEIIPTTKKLSCTD